MLTAIKDRRLFDRFMKNPPYGTYFEAVFKDRPERVIRVMTDKLRFGSFLWIDPDTQRKHVEWSSPWGVKPLNPSTERLLESVTYSNCRKKLIAHIERIYDAAHQHNCCYPVYCDQNDYLWYITPSSRYEPGRNWAIELWCPTTNELSLIEWDHGPFMWMFYRHGYVQTHLNRELWVTREELLSHQQYGTRIL